MNLYFIRHGEAESSFPDEQRRLSEKGKTTIINSCSIWKKFVDGFDLIISSPLVRAVETADIIKKEFNFLNEILIDQKLRPGSNIEDIIELANSLNLEDTVFIGHQPDFSIHISKLISTGEVLIKMKAGAIAKVSFDKSVKLNKGRLEFLLPPGLI